MEANMAFMSAPANLLSTQRIVFSTANPCSQNDTSIVGFRSAAFVEGSGENKFVFFVLPFSQLFRKEMFSYVSGKK